MKALTIRQPYAHLIVIGEKRVENRSRQTVYRGPLLIHAGKSRSWVVNGDLQRYPDMVFGAIIGRVELVECLRLIDIHNGNLPLQLAWVRRHRHTEGPWCWVLEQVQRFPRPIPWRGNRYLFDVPDDVIPQC